MINQMCLSSFKKLDIFGSEITLNYNKESLFRTPFGGLVAIVCILTLVLLFFNNNFDLDLTIFLELNQLLQKQILTLIGKSKQKYLFVYQEYQNINLFLNITHQAQVSTVSSIFYDPDPDISEVGYNQMMIAVKFNQENFIGRPKMNITFEKRHYTKFQNGTYDQEKIPVPLEPCTLEHFENLPNYHINWTENFQLSGIGDYLCLKKGENYKIGGTYENEHFYHIKYILKECVNQTDYVGSWKPVCDTPENINKTTEDVRIKFLFSNTLLNPESTSEPIQTHVETVFFNVQPQQMYTTANIMLSEQIVRTDESVTLFKDIQEKDFISFKQGDFKQQFAVGNFTKFAEIFFLKSNFSYTINRTFLKIDQVISYMGGFCQVFLLFSAIIGNQFDFFFHYQIFLIKTVSQFNEYVYNIELANKLYDFDIQDKSKNKYKPLSKNNTQSSIKLGVKSNMSQNTPVKYHTESDCTQRSNQMQSFKYMQDSPLNQQNKNNLLSKNDTKNQDDKKAKLHQQQNQKIQISQAVLNIHKEDNGEQNDMMQRLDSTRPIFSQTNNSKVIQQSKFSSQREIPIINLEKCDYSQNIFLEQTKNNIKKLNPQQSDKSNREQLNEIDIKKMNSSINKQKQNHIQLEKPYSKNNFNTIYSVQKGSLLDINSEVILNTEQEQNLGQIGVLHSQHIRVKQDKSANDNKQFLEQELKYIVQRDRTLWLNVKYFINKISCGKFYNTNEVVLLNKAIEMVKQDLDIFNILDRQKEIEKFKKLFLTPDQQVLFNFFPKPLIKTNQEEVLITRQSLKKQETQKQQSSFSQLKRNQTKKLNLKMKNVSILSKAVMKFKQNLRSQEISDYQALFNCYEKMMQKNSSEVEKIVNKKLIDQLGNEMKTIFEAAYRMKQKQNEKEQVLSFSKTNQATPSHHNIFIPSFFKNINMQQQNTSSVNDSVPQSSTYQQHQDLNQIYQGNMQNAMITSIEKDNLNQFQLKDEQEKKQNIQDENDDNLIIFEQEEIDPNECHNQNNQSNSTAEKEIDIVIQKPNS